MRKNGVLLSRSAPSQCVKLESLNSACCRTKLEKKGFHPEQQKALLGHDVYVNLPTGFWNSAIFQASARGGDITSGGSTKMYNSRKCS